MQRGHDDLRRRHAFLGMNVNRNAAAVVAHGHRLAWMDHDLNFVAMARQSLVDGVVHQFLHHVVQPGAVLGVTDVHAGTLAHRIETAQHLDVARIVGFFSHKCSLASPVQELTWPCST